jgi:hypothetical protein
MSYVNRRGTVSTSATQLALTMRDSQLGAPNNPYRPLVGANQDGLHYQPRVGETVLALAETAGWTTTTVAAIDSRQGAPSPASMTPGSTILFSQGTAVLSAVFGTMTLSHATWNGALQVTGVATVTTAGAGAASLPSAPDAFLPLTVNGISYKLPLYLP